MQLQQEEADKRNEREAERKAEAAAEAERLAAQRSTAARVQFRLPDGRSQTRSFDAGAPLSGKSPTSRKMTHVCS